MANKEKEMSIGFEVIDDATIIVYKRGIYKQVSAYKRNGNVYAGAGTGFVRLKMSGATSDPSLKWEEVEGLGDISKDVCNGKWMEAKK